MRTYINRSLSIVVTLGLLSSACGDYRSLKSKIIGHQSKNGEVVPQKDEAQEAHLNKKWAQLVEYLGFEAKAVKNKDELTNLLSTPSMLFTSKTKQYDGLMDDLKKDLAKNRKKMRCGGISSFTHLKDSKGNDMQVHGSDVFHMEYQDQMKEATKRTALVFLPQKTSQKKELPLLLHLAGGDMGLAINKLDFTQPMLESHVVIAPDYSMGTCEKHASAGQACKPDNLLLTPELKEQDKPWEEDVYSSLAAHNCVVEAVSNEEGRGTFKSGPIPFDDEEKSLRKELTDRSITIAMIAENPDYPSFLNKMMQAPVSKIFGSSRGGLVALLAVAYSGVEWEIFQKVFEDLSQKVPEKRLVEALHTAIKAHENFGEDYSKTIMQYPPMFSQLVNNAGPFSLMVGEFRVLVEQVVKNVHNPLKQELPGVRHLLEDFAVYTDAPIGNDAAELKDVALLIFRRDMHFLHPYLYSGLLNWNDLLLAKFKPNKIRHGKLLALHSVNDKIVPFTQAFGTIKTFKGMDKKRAEAKDAYNKGEKVSSFALLALAFLPGIEVTPAYTKGASKENLGLYHNDEAFWEHTVVVPPGDKKKLQEPKDKEQLALVDAWEKKWAGDLAPADFLQKWMSTP